MAKEPFEANNIQALKFIKSLREDPKIKGILHCSFAHSKEHGALVWAYLPPDYIEEKGLFENLDDRKECTRVAFHVAIQNIAEVIFYLVKRKSKALKTMVAGLEYEFVAAMQKFLKTKGMIEEQSDGIRVRGSSDNLSKNEHEDVMFLQKLVEIREER